MRMYHVFCCISKVKSCATGHYVGPGSEATAHRVAVINANCEPSLPYRLLPSTLSRWVTDVPPINQSDPPPFTHSTRSLTSLSYHRSIPHPFVFASVHLNHILSRNLMVSVDSIINTIQSHLIVHPSINYKQNIHLNHNFILFNYLFHAINSISLLLLTILLVNWFFLLITSFMVIELLEIVSLR